MTITFIGHGYVGLVTAAVFADLGNTVWVIGHTISKIENLKKGIIPIYEPGLAEVVKRGIKAKRLHFTLDYTSAIPQSDVVFIAVGTPSGQNGEADLSTVFEVAKKLGKHLDEYTIVITKSTVPVGTNNKVKQIVENVKSKKATFDVASVPEFLREGQAVSDTLHPDRIIIGTESKKAEKMLIELHSPIDGETLLTNIETAEMIKYASNSFLATKISFANAIARISELAGADGTKVLEGIGLDRRIGSTFLNAGAGYGGSCFPKDVKALIVIAKQYGYDFTLLKNVEEINNEAMISILNKAKRLLKDTFENKIIAVLGLSFKPDTDDMRDAPSVFIIKRLLAEGAKIHVYDPVAADNAKKILSGVTFFPDPYSCVKDTHVMVVVTEWNEFRQLDLSKIKLLMANPAILDGRNIYDPAIIKSLGFTYVGVGR